MSATASQPADARRERPSLVVTFLVSVAACAGVLFAKTLVFEVPDFMERAMQQSLVLPLPSQWLIEFRQPLVYLAPLYIFGPLAIFDAPREQRGWLAFVACAGMAFVAAMAYLFAR